MFIECTVGFYGVHRQADEPTYHAACDEFKQLATEGKIDGGEFRVSIGDRQGSASVFVTIWRNVPAMAAIEWSQDIDTGEEHLKYRYTRSFNPATTTPAEVIAATREMLLAPQISH